MKFIMTVFKLSGKYYTTEEIEVPDISLFELQGTQQYKEWEHKYDTMYKSCVPDETTEEYKKSTIGGVPFLIFPKKKETRK